MMNKIVVFGDSVTSGMGTDPSDLGLDNTSCDYLWINTLINEIDQFKDHEVINLARCGFSNQDMVNHALWYIGKNDDIKYIIMAWVDPVRFNYEIGFELYDTVIGFRRTRDHILNDITYSESFLNKRHLEMMGLLHGQHEIVRMVQQVNLMLDVTKKLGITLVNVNVNCPWDHGLFDRKTGKFDIESLSSVTKELLNVDNRDDEEIYKLYEKQHGQYEKWGGIRKESWANLYDPFYLDNNTAYHVDFAPDGRHPGPETNKIFVEKIRKYFDKINSH